MLTERLRRTQLAAAKTRFVTPCLVAINSVAFLLVVIQSKGLEPSALDLVKCGANFGPKTLNGQWWRLLSNTFLHASVPHLLFNMVVLYDLGMLVETLVGNWNILLLYLLSGVGGSLASLAVHPIAAGVGASGAVFGLCGGLVGHLMQRDNRFRLPLRKALLKRTSIFIGLNLAYGIVQKQIDVAAHLGGLVTGFAIGMVLLKRAKGYAWSGPRILVGAMVTVVLFVVAANNLRILVRAPLAAEIQVSAREELIPEGAVAEIVRFLDLDTRVVQLYNSKLQEYQGGQLRTMAMALTINVEILPPWRLESEQFLKVPSHPVRLGKLKTEVVQYMKLREEGWVTLALGLRNNDAGKIRWGLLRQDEAELAAARIRHSIAAE